MPVVEPPPWVALVVDTEGLQHHNAHLESQPNHASLDVFDMPYRTADLLQLIRHIQANPREGVEVWVSEREAKDEELARGGATSRRYLAHCKRLSKLMLKVQRAGSAGSGDANEHVWFKWLDDDETSVVTATSMTFARRAVGAALTAADAIWAGEAQHAFVLCRPPGHHNGSNEALEAAERDSFRFASHGGCLLNETAVAIHHLRHLADHRRVGGAAQRGAGLRTRLERSAKCLRAAVLDLDVHFGDGTAWQFYDDASVLTVSVHLDQSEAGQFPYLKGNARERGDGDGRGANINLPIKEGMDDAHAWALLRQCAFPAIQAHAPDVLFVALGTDGLCGDPTEAGVCYTPALFAAVLRWCRSACSHVLVTLQGGYQSQPLATAVDTALRALCHEVDEGTSAPDMEGLAVGERGDPDRAHIQAYVDSVRSQLDADDRWWSWEESFAYCVQEDTSGGAVEEGGAHEQGGV